MKRLTCSVALAALAVGLCLAGTPASPALGASNPVITDCVAHGQLNGSYSVQQLHHALEALSASTRQYTNCSDVISRALAAALHGKPGGGTGSAGSGSFLPTPVVVILVLLLLGAVTFGALAVRRRRGDAPSD